MNKSVSFLTVINIIQMLSSVAIQALIAISLGANWQRDSLFIAMSIPLFINVILTGSVSFMLTPITASYKSSTIIRLFYNKVLLVLLLIALVVCFVLNLQSGNIIKLLAPGFGNKEFFLTKTLFYYGLLIIPIQAISSIVNSYWVTVEKTLFPSISLVLGNLITIFYIIYNGNNLTAESAINAIIFGYGLTSIVTTIAYILPSNGIFQENENNITHKELNIRILPFLREVSILLLLLTINRSASILESRFASNFDIGTISNLRYAAYIVTFLVNAVSTPVITVYYAELCRQWNNKAWDKISNFFEQGILTLTVVGSIIASISILSIDELLNVFLSMTKFTSSQMVILGSYIKLSMITFILLSLSNFLGRIFYISNRFVLVALIDVVVLIFYIGFSQLLSSYFLGYGLSLAYCLYSIMLFTLYVFLSKSKFNIEFSIIFRVKILTILLICLVSFGVGYLLKYFLSFFTYPILCAFVGILAFLISFTLASFKFKLISYMPFLGR